MADIRLAKPVAGTTQTVPSAPDGRFIFDFPAESIAKRMIKYLLFARSHEIWQREIL